VSRLAIFLMSPNYEFVPIMGWRWMCRRSSILIKIFCFPKSKERLDCKN